MDIQDLQVICEKLKAVTQDIKWEAHLCFTIGGKMFLMTSPDEIPHSCSFKVVMRSLMTIAVKKVLFPRLTWPGTNG